MKKIINQNYKVTSKMLKLSEFCDSKEICMFLNALKNKWDNIHNETSVFRYKINNLKEKVVDGYLLQLNPDRNAKRRTPEHIDNICQPFDEEKFNFTKVSPQEIMFNIIGDDNDTDVHNILVNVSPISRYHSLLCPSVNKRLPQVVTLDSLELAIKLMFLAGDRSFRIGFNSLCALASVNHLHYHLFVEENVLPVESVAILTKLLLWCRYYILHLFTEIYFSFPEKTKCKHLCGPVYYLNEDYPSPAFCFEAATSESTSDTSRDVYKLLDYFIKNSIAHNIFMTRGQGVSSSSGNVLRVLVWPRKSSAGVKQLSAFNVAVCELSGWFPVYNAEDYENLQKEHLEDELKKWNVNEFEKLCSEIILLF